MWFEKFWVEVLHLRHHTCGSWGRGPFPQVRCPPGLLARCGWSASVCCRHVDNSTAVHSERRSSTCTPLVAPCSSPCRVHDGRPVRRVVGLPRRPIRRTCWSEACRARCPVCRHSEVEARRGDRGPVPGRISPTCAHSWGQLLDVSTGSLVDDEPLSRRNWGSAVHGVPHNCGQRHVDPASEAGGRPRRRGATGRAGRPRPSASAAIPAVDREGCDEAGPEGPRGVTRGRGPSLGDDWHMRCATRGAPRDGADEAGPQGPRGDPRDGAQGNWGTARGRDAVRRTADVTAGRGS
jgi:hypothetical protein